MISHAFYEDIPVTVIKISLIFPKGSGTLIEGLYIYKDLAPRWDHIIKLCKSA